jgi:IS5 family transposase
MFKALLLQRWHGLSDPEMETALADRLSFIWPLLACRLAIRRLITRRFGDFARSLASTICSRSLLAEAKRRMASAHG